MGLGFISLAVIDHEESESAGRIKFFVGLNVIKLHMQEVSREDLVPGKEYYLQSFEESCLPPNKSYKMIARFEKLEPSSAFIPFMWSCFTNFRNITHRNDHNYIRCVRLNYNWKFYEVARHEVQKNMEQRAYNMVLLHIIGDEYFIPAKFIK